jgi:hypothetical protein
MTAIKCFRQPEQQRKRDEANLLGGCFTRALDEAADSLRRLCAFGNPGVHLVEVNIGVFTFLLWVISAQDFEETTIALETLVCGDDTVKQTAFGAFLTETNCYCHEIKYKFRTFGEAEVAGDTVKSNFYF